MGHDYVMPEGLVDKIVTYDIGDLRMRNACRLFAFADILENTQGITSDSVLWSIYRNGYNKGIDVYSADHLMDYRDVIKMADDDYEKVREHCRKTLSCEKTDVSSTSYDHMLNREWGECKTTYCTLKDMLISSPKDVLKAIKDNAGEKASTYIDMCESMLFLDMEGVQEHLSEVGYTEETAADIMGKIIDWCK